MYGIVLWSGDEGRKAVIWCEDHGDLAFFHDPEHALVLEAGDMVRLRTQQTRRMRLAHEVSVVEQDKFRGIADRLKRAGAMGQGAEIVPFPIASAHGDRPACRTDMAAAL